MALPEIDITQLPDFDTAVALHGSRNDTGPSVGAVDDLWVLAVIVVYELQ